MSTSADGLKGTDEALVPVEGGEYVHEAKIGQALMDADIVISLTHFKGHEQAGFGGAMKNLGMGGGVDVLERVFAATDVERVAVGEEGLAAQLFYDVRDGAGVVGAQKAQVAQLAKVNLDSNELVLKVDLLNTGAANEALELVELALASMRAQVRKYTLAGAADAVAVIDISPLSIWRYRNRGWYKLKQS